LTTLRARRKRTCILYANFFLTKRGDGKRKRTFACNNADHVPIFFEGVQEFFKLAQEGWPWN
jgi:hypothetical protein